MTSLAWRRRVRAALVAGTGLCAGLAAQANGMLDVKWPEEGPFKAEVNIAPGKMAEACVPLKQGLRVAWSYRSSQPLDFNIHHHEGKLVHYSERASQSAQRAGIFAVPVPEVHCWMWQNPGREAAVLMLELGRPAP